MAFEDDLLALEQRVLREAAGDFLAAVAILRRMLAGNETGIARRLIELAIPAVEAVATAGVAEAYQLGGSNAITSATAAPDTSVNAVSDAEGRLRQPPPADLVEPFHGLDQRLVDAKQTALSLLNAGSPVEEACAPVFNAANTVQARVVSQVNAAANAGTLEVADAVKSPLVWVAERDACVYCLGLAGKVIQQAGDNFPKADLYADGGSANRVVQQPPLHPHCRCQLDLLVDDSYADALEREAQRSILRGFSLQSESNAVRVRAADRLLARDPVAPKSVKAYARKAVKEGRFPRGREVPDGGPRLVDR